MTATSGVAHGTSSRSPLKLAATVVGAMFVLVGLLGFVPGITEPYDQLRFAGHESEAKLLGLFQISVLHNLVHLLFGVAGLAMARRADTAKKYLLYGGIIYLVLFVFGLLIGDEVDINFVPLNLADDFLHLGLGTGMIALALLLDRDHGGRH